MNGKMINELSSLNVHQVVESGNYELFKYLVDLDINLIDSTDDDYGRTPLMICACEKTDAHMKIAKYLLDCGCDINIQANYKWRNMTALMTACRYDNFRMVEILINANANLELQSSDGHTAWQIAFDYSYRDCINLILSEMEEKKIENRMSLAKDLHDAVFDNDFEKTKECLDKIDKNDIKQFVNTSITNHTLLYRACRNGNAEIVRLLLDYGAIARPHYHTKYSPLYLACHMGNVDIAKMILEKFPHLIKVTTLEKFSPLHAACSQGHLSVLKLLLEFDPLDRARNDHAAAFTAEYALSLKQIYFDSKSDRYVNTFDLNACDFNEQTALFAAVQANRYEICEYLLTIKYAKLTDEQVKRFENKVNRKLKCLLTSGRKSIPTSQPTNEPESTSFFDQLKSVFMDPKVNPDPYVINYTSNPVAEPQSSSSPALPRVESTATIQSDDELEPAEYFNPINLNCYSKPLGTTCLHEAIRNRNLKLVQLLVSHGADANQQIFDFKQQSSTATDSNQDQKQQQQSPKPVSNCLCEAAKMRDENLFLYLIDNFAYNEFDFRMVFRQLMSQMNDDQPFARRMLPILLKFKIIYDSEFKISLRSGNSRAMINSQPAAVVNGMILNWNNLEPKLNQLYESWFFNSLFYLKSDLLASNDSLLSRKFHLHMITRVDLSNNALESLPFSLFQIESLRFLKLANNSLRKLPTLKDPQLDDVSLRTDRFVRVLYWTCNLLEELDLEGNQLSELPAQLFQLKSLKHLNVCGNALETLPLDMWQAPSLYDLNVSHNKLTHLPVLDVCSLKNCLSAGNSRSRALSNPIEKFLPMSRSRRAADERPQKLPVPSRKVPVVDHPLKSPPPEENKIFTPAVQGMTPVKAMPNFSQKPVEKANFWNAHSINMAASSFYDDLADDLTDDGQIAASRLSQQQIVTNANRECKLIELNLSHNKLSKIPECLSCLTPKLVKLNLSSNQIESMGAVCDLPNSLKFLDLSNNQIKHGMHLLNVNLLKFILIYFRQHHESLNSMMNSSYINNIFVNLLLDNEFCYLNLIRKTLNLNGGMLVDDHGSSSGGNRSIGVIKSRLREKSMAANGENLAQRRRTRSHSRNYRATAAAAATIATGSSGNNTRTKDAPVQEKRLIPFDLFLINLRYNRTYPSAAGEQNFDISKLIDEFLTNNGHENLDELIRKERVLLNNQNIQVFLEQLCPHKRHIKLDNLKWINVSNNLLKKFTFMFDLSDRAVNLNEINATTTVNLTESDSELSDVESESSGEDSDTEKSRLRKVDKKPSKKEDRVTQQAKLMYPNLAHLDLSSNRLKYLKAEVSLLENLSYLNVSSNLSLLKVSPKIGLLTKLWNFELKGCVNLKEPNMLESLINGKTKTSDVLGYLKSILEHSKPYTRMKLMFVGVQAIGKTSLLNKLREEGSTQTPRSRSIWAPANNNTNMSTVGIDINEWVYDKPKQKGHSSSGGLLSSSPSSNAMPSLTANSLQASASSVYLYQLDGGQGQCSNKNFGPITFRTWDFAGQKEYYTTHQYFISRRAIYLVCWKLSEEDKGINEIHHWLSNIQSRAPGSPCIIVGTHQDQLVKLKNYKEISNYLQRLIYERFVRPSSETESTSAYPPIMASVEISSKTGYNVKTLARIVYDVATQMKAPGIKDQVLLEQKVPVTYLALEECVYYVLNNFKAKSRNPFLNTSNYLKEIRAALNTLYPDEVTEKQIGQLTVANNDSRTPSKGTPKKVKNKKLLIRFRDDTEILQATQFLHENGILIHYNDVALNDLFFLDPQWLCDILATVVTIREINPFAVKGIMKIKDLLFLFKGSRFNETDEIMSFIVDLLSKFELALTWDNEHLLIPSLLPTEAMLQFSNQDLRTSIVSKQKAYSEHMSAVSYNSLLNPHASPAPPHQMPASVSCISSFLQPNGASSASANDTQQQKDEISSLFSNIKLSNSFSQSTIASKINLNFQYECKPIRNTAATSGGHSKPYSNIRRLYCLNYLPSGFFSRLITRILCDNILKECLLELIELDYCQLEDQNNSSKIIDFVCQEAEWKCWQTGIELRYLDYTLIRVKEILLDPLVDFNIASSGGSGSRIGANLVGVGASSVPGLSSSPSSASSSSSLYSSTPTIHSTTCKNELFAQNSVLYRDCETDEFKLKSIANKQNSFIECYASFRNYKIVKLNNEANGAGGNGAPNKASNGAKHKFSSRLPSVNYSDDDDEFVGDEDQQSNADSTDDSNTLVKILCNRKVSIKIYALIIEIIDNLLEDWYPDLGTRFMQDSKGEYLVTRLAPCSSCIKSAKKRSAGGGAGRSRRTRARSSLKSPLAQDAAGELFLDSFSINAADNQSSVSTDTDSIHSANNDTINYDLVDDPNDRSILAKYESLDWIYCFMLDDVCYSVLKNSSLVCPKHGQQHAGHIAPDLAFEDIEEKLLISNDSLKIESLLGRGSFGSVFSGSLLLSSPNDASKVNNTIKVAVKVLETLKTTNAPSSTDDENNNKRISRASLNKNWNYRKSIRNAAKAYTIARQEISIVSSLKNENIVSMIGLSIQPLAIILELAPLGNLKDILNEYKKLMSKLSAQVVQMVSIQISSALVYLHSNRIIYRDLKSDNVLVWRFPKPNLIQIQGHGQSRDLVFIKLADYSTGRCVLPTGTKGFAGTPGFMAPEILKYKGEETYSEKVDSFSFGMLLYELITLKHPFEGQEQIKDIILNGGRPLIKTSDLEYPTLMLDLMCLCWLDNPVERPTAVDMHKYASSFEFSHLLDVSILDDYQQAPLLVSCLNQEQQEENYEIDRMMTGMVTGDEPIAESRSGRHGPANPVTNSYVVNENGQYYLDNDSDNEDEEIEEDDLIDLWVVRNSLEENASQLEVLTYENKLNCVNRKLIYVSKEKIEAICVYNGNQIWLVDALKTVFVFCSRSYKKLTQFMLNVPDHKAEIISIYPLENLRQILVCNSYGTIIFLKVDAFHTVSLQNNRIDPSINLDDDVDYFATDLSIKVSSTVLLPSRYDTNYDLWLGSDNTEIFCYSLKQTKLTGSCLHSSSHHFYANSILTGKTQSPPFNSGIELNFVSPTPPDSPLNKIEPQNYNVTLMKTTSIDSFFLWSYIYPGFTIYLWNHVSKKIMSSYNCLKAFDDLNAKNLNTSNKDFKVVDMTFLNGNLYCGINSGVVLILKRLTLTPLLIFKAHVHQLNKLCPLSFDTRLTTLNKKQPNAPRQSRQGSNNSYRSPDYSPTQPVASVASTVVKKTHHILLSLGKALAPVHEDIYLSSPKYRIEALRKYENCLILNSWNCTNND